MSLKHNMIEFTTCDNKVSCYCSRRNGILGSTLETIIEEKLGQGDTGVSQGLQGVKRGYKGLQGVTAGLKGVTGGYKGLPGVTRGYRRLKGVTGG